MTCECQSMDECIGCQNAEAEIERLTEREWWLETEYERLKAEVERLQAALQALADDASVPPWIRTLARHALEPKP